MAEGDRALGEPAVARRAATIVLVRDLADGIEVLLTRRPATMAFAAGVDVFPGGAVDPGDRDERAAAVREVAEEAGITVGRESLVPLSRWVTPAWMPRRFDTRFFAARLPPGAEPVFDPSEVVAHRWTSPGDALRDARAGDLVLWPPTEITLRQLEHVGSFAEIADRLAADGEAALPAASEVESGVIRVATWGAGGVPGQQVNSWIVAAGGEAVVVDPGDPSPEVADAIAREARGRGLAVRAILLTHPDPDHAAGAVGLVETLGGAVPVHAARDGDVIGSVRAHATPGHHPDHVALEVLRTGLVVSGDLVGQQASRSVLGPFDSRAWLRSLDRLAALRPRLLLPGHGEPIADVEAAVDAERTRLGDVSRAAAPRPGSA